MVKIFVGVFLHCVKEAHEGSEVAKVELRFVESQGEKTWGRYACGSFRGPARAEAGETWGSSHLREKGAGVGHCRCLMWLFLHLSKWSSGWHRANNPPVQPPTWPSQSFKLGGRDECRRLGLVSSDLPIVISRPSRAPIRLYGNYVGLDPSAAFRGIQRRQQSAITVKAFASTQQL